MSGSEAEYADLRRTGRGGWGRGAYDRRRAGWTGTLDRLQGADLIPPAPAELLEFGCGNAMVSLEAARRGYRMDGIDVSATAIAWARERFAAASLAGSFQQGDACAMPCYEDARFDVVLDG